MSYPHDRGFPQDRGFPPHDQGFPPQDRGFPSPPPWGGPPIGYAQEHPQGTTVLVLGILSLVLCSLLGPFAWGMGNTAMREIDASPGVFLNRGAVQAGRICGIIGTCFLILTVLALVLLMAAGTAGTA